MGMPAVPGRPAGKKALDRAGAPTRNANGTGRESAPPDSEIPPHSGGEGPREKSIWGRIWCFPITRIAVFVLLLACFFVAFAVPIEHIDALNYMFWAEAPAVIAALALMARIEGRSLADFGLTRERVALRDVILGFVVGGITMSLVVGLMAVRGWYHCSPGWHSPGLAGSMAMWIFVYLSIAVSEELIYRGYFFQTLERRWGSDIAFAATMVTFGLMHLTIDVPHASAGLKVIGSLSIAVEAGILFATAYLLTRRLWMPIGIHWAWNFFEGPVFGTPVTGSNTEQPLLQGHITGPSWATGGGFGPEASIPALLIGTALGLLFLWFVQIRKRRKSG